MGWTESGTATKFDTNDEEGWALLPNGKVLTIDVYTGDESSTPPALRTNSEVYDPSTGTWSSAGSTIHTLTDSISNEIGASILRPDGTVFALGANSTGNTSIYDSNTGTWTVGLSLASTPSQQACQDAPAALLPNGNVFLLHVHTQPILLTLMAFLQRAFLSLMVLGIQNNLLLIFR
jgi:hypothetical protein